MIPPNRPAACPGEVLGMIPGSWRGGRIRVTSASMITARVWLPRSILVTVKSQISGYLMQVDYKEGQP